MQQPTSNFEEFTFHKKDQKPQVETSNPTPHSNSTNLLRLHSMSSRPKLLHEAINFQGIFKLKRKNPWNEQPMDMNFSPKSLTHNPPKLTMTINIKWKMCFAIPCIPTFSTQANSEICFQPWAMYKWVNI